MLIMALVIISSNCNGEDEETEKLELIAGSLDTAEVFKDLKISGLEPEDVTLEVAKNTIIVTVPYSVDLKYIQNVFTLPEGTTSEPKSEDIVDFSEGEYVRYRITYNDGSIESFYIIVQKRKPLDSESNSTEDIIRTLETYRNSKLIEDTTVNIEGNNIEITVPYGTDLTAIKNIFSSKKITSVSPSRTEEVDFSKENSHKYTISYPDESSIEVNITIIEKSQPMNEQIANENVFTFIEVYEGKSKINDVTIEKEDNYINITVPNSTDLSIIRNYFTIPKGATSNITSGSNVDYSVHDTKEYEVTYSDETKENFYIKVTKSTPTVAEISGAEYALKDLKIYVNSVLVEDVSVIIDGDKVNIITPYSTDLSSVKITYTAPGGSECNYPSGTLLNFEAKNTKTYEVTYNDKSTDSFEVKITKSDPTIADTTGKEDLFLLETIKVKHNDIMYTDTIIEFNEPNIINIQILTEHTCSCDNHQSYLIFDFTDIVDYTEPVLTTEFLLDENFNGKEYKVVYTDGSSDVFVINIEGNH